MPRCCIAIHELWHARYLRKKVDNRPSGYIHRRGMSLPWEETLEPEKSALESNARVST